MSHTWQARTYTARRRTQFQKRLITSRRSVIRKQGWTTEEVRDLVAQMRRQGVKAPPIRDERVPGELRYVAAGGEA